MKLLKFLALLLLISVSFGEFILEEVTVYIHDIEADGSAKVSESIKLFLYDEANEEYDSGFNRNDLSFWSTITGLQDIKQHVNPAKVEISDFIVRPQPRSKCNPIQGTCHGELILEYTASPSYNITEDGEAVPIQGTGLFSVEKYKPRTTKYTIEPEALSFTITSKGSLLLEENIYLRMGLPQETVVLDLNPKPEDLVDTELPARINELEWNDIILVKFSVIFEVEEPLEKEVSEFFYDLFGSIQDLLTGEYGGALLAIIIIIIGGYLYITIEKRTRG